VTFTLADTFGHTVPAGTNLRIPASVTGTVDVYFTTDAATISAAGNATTNPVGITGTVNTDAANAIPAGVLLDVLDPLYIVNFCQLTQSVGAGALPESGIAFLSRGVTALRSLNSTLVRSAQFVDYALANGAFRAFAEDNYDATLGSSAEGVISVAVIGENGALLSSGAKTAMSVAMNALTQANLVVRVVDPTITTVAVTATVMAVAGQDPTALHTAVLAAVNGYLSANLWPWNSTVRVNKLLNVIETVPGVDYVVGNLTAPTGDVALTGFGPLAVAGTVTVTVETP
jgi:hypothetical protein